MLAAAYALIRRSPSSRDYLTEVSGAINSHRNAHDFLKRTLRALRFPHTRACSISVPLLAYAYPTTAKWQRRNRPS
jgi:hypothetical protein